MTGRPKCLFTASYMTYIGPMESVIVRSDFFYPRDGRGKGANFGGNRLCSEGPLFRRFYVPRSYIPKVICSEITRFYVPKVLYSENNFECSIFRRSYVPKKSKALVLYSEGSIFRNFRLCIPLRVGCRFEDSQSSSTIQLLQMKK